MGRVDNDCVSGGSVAEVRNNYVTLQKNITIIAACPCIQIKLRS